MVNGNDVPNDLLMAHFLMEIRCKEWPNSELCNITFSILFISYQLTDCQSYGDAAAIHTIAVRPVTDYLMSFVVYW